MILTGFYVNCYDIKIGEIIDWDFQRCITLWQTKQKATSLFGLKK